MPKDEGLRLSRYYIKDEYLSEDKFMFSKMIMWLFEYLTICLKFIFIFN